MQRKITKYNLLLFFEALCYAYWFKILLLFRSFKSFADRHPSTGTITDYDKEALKRVRRAIRRSNKFIWWKNKCLVNTFCARKMLNKRNIASKAYLGLRKDSDNDTLNAHAWITSNDVFIVPIEYNYATVHEF